MHENTTVTMPFEDHQKLLDEIKELKIKLKEKESFGLMYKVEESAISCERLTVTINRQSLQDHIRKNNEPYDTNIKYVISD